MPHLKSFLKSVWLEQNTFTSYVLDAIFELLDNYQVSGHGTLRPNTLTNPSQTE